MSGLTTLVRGAVVFGIAAILFAAVGASAQGRPDCAAVLRAMNKTSKNTRNPSAVKVGESIGVDPQYVQTCAASYGRRLRHHESLLTRPPTDDEMDTSEKREAEEFDEISHEEKETEGDKYTQVIPDDENNRKKIEHTRNDDTPNEWDAPVEHRGWAPFEDKPWLPFERADDE